MGSDNPWRGFSSGLPVFGIHGYYLEKGDAIGISTLQDAIKLSGVIDLVPHLRTAVSAPIFIPVAVRKNQEKEFVDRDRTPAGGAVEFSGIQFLEMILALPSRSGRRACESERAVFH
jgi:hypothetical protein